MKNMNQTSKCRISTGRDQDKPNMKKGTIVLRKRLPYMVKETFSPLGGVCVANFSLPSC